MKIFAFTDIVYGSVIPVEVLANSEEEAIILMKEDGFIKGYFDDDYLVLMDLQTQLN